MLTIVVHEVLIGPVPDLSGDGTAGVQVHSHTLLLRSLTSEHIGRHRLINFGLAKDNLVLGLLVTGFHLNNLATADHTNMLESDLNVIIGENHADQ